MKKLVPFLALLLINFIAVAQTPVVMSAQAGLSYTENFTDVANWSNGFTTGIGANRFKAVAVLNTGTIPAPVKTTISTATFQTNSTGGVQKGIGNLILLSTGTTDNTTSTAVDFFANFTGVNAGVLNFSWAEVDNGTGDRKASLKVYASIDGTNFTELTTAAVSNFTNNVATSGTRSNVALPATFSNNANARLRFYYYNGVGGTSGSRPKISIDNFNVTAVPRCVTPTAQPTSLVLSGITSSNINGAFTAAASTSKYLIVKSINSALTSNPVNGITYNIGDGVGDGTVIAKGTATTFTAPALSPSTRYYFYMFAYDSTCTTAPNYFTTSPLTNSAVTLSNLPNCVAPTVQPTALVFGNTTVNSIAASFTANANTAIQYLIVQSTSSSLSAQPVNAQVYVAGQVLGNGVVVQSGANASYTASGLAAGTVYYYTIYSFNSQQCLNGPVYNTTAPLTGNRTTIQTNLCVNPTTQATALSLTAAASSISGNFSPSANADSYLIVRSISPSLSATPADNVDYAIGASFGGGIVLSNSNSTTFVASGLSATTTYYFYIFASNKSCNAGTKYLNSNPLTGNSTTINSSTTNNYYFGTLHAHSDFSDGNKDNPGFTPADDYLYAMSSQCLDYLGISEHNHFSSANNPGNQVVNYHTGTTQANNFNATHNNFVAMYGMEWGVISGGGHVVVYGDGMDQLFGWETGSGVWGPSNNYDVFVAKNDYTGASGLFKTINDRANLNTFATLAHPNSADFGNLAGTAYNQVADNAIVGAAVESGPAFSVSTTYNDPATSLGSISYYRTMLSKGYHLGPTMDHDNHNTTFGRTTTSRTAIVAPSLTRAALVNAMAKMNFYATQDCDTKVNFTINTNIMGSVFTDRFEPNVSVTLTDNTTSVANANILLMYGAPGSNILPVQIASGTGGNFTFTDNNLLNNTTGYYYLEITNGTGKIVTSPIWYTRNDNFVTALIAKGFTVLQEGTTAKINWNTDATNTAASFVIEHSTDGQQWNELFTISENGSKNYFVYDINPSITTNYYRIKEINALGKIQYTDVKSITFKENYFVTVAPNPAKEFINIYKKENRGEVLIQLINVNGTLIKNIKTSDAITHISTAAIAKGMYFVKVMDKTEMNVIKVVVQ